MAADAPTATDAKIMTQGGSSLGSNFMVTPWLDLQRNGRNNNFVTESFHFFNHRHRESFGSCNLSKRLCDWTRRVNRPIAVNVFDFDSDLHFVRSLFAAPSGHRFVQLLLD